MYLIKYVSLNNVPFFELYVRMDFFYLQFLCFIFLLLFIDICQLDSRFPFYMDDVFFAFVVHCFVLGCLSNV